MTLRELRLWHWNKALSFRRTAERHEAAAAERPGNSGRHHRNKAKAARGREDWHLRAVAAFRDVVEGDMELSDAQKAPRHCC